MYHPRTNNIHHPTLQFMHKWLDFTLFPNSDFGTVRVDDLRLLYALVKRRKVPPVKSKMRHCLEVFSLTGDLTGETFLLLTKAYNSLRSSTLTVRKSSLGNKVKPSHLCMNRNVGWWISLVWGRYISVFSINFSSKILTYQNLVEHGLDQLHTINWILGENLNLSRKENILSQKVWI